MSGSCCGDGGDWSGGPLMWPAGELGQRYKWEVTFPDGDVQVYDTDSQAYAAVSRSGGGIRRIAAPGV